MGGGGRGRELRKGAEEFRYKRAVHEGLVPRISKSMICDTSRHTETRWDPQISLAKWARTRHLGPIR